MEAQIQNAYRAFLNFTLAKRRECFKDFSEGQREAFVIIPYLLHTSEPKRLGYVDGILAPCGIYGYKFSEEVKAIGKKHFSVKDRFEDPKSVAGAPIESLSIMGSAGSIAQTEGSDLDYWVSIRDTLKPAERKLLQDKLVIIEKWCMEELNAEVHFFVSTAKDLRDNNFGEVNKESCGSALGKLLKEEYYRTSLHVMGKIPLWWLAPYNSNDETYSTVPKFLGAAIGVENKDFIDFGNSRNIPSDEFVGGGMWQLNKGVGSPFKSALKMALLVEYADDGQPRDLLAQMLKRRMLENPNDIDQLDPYRMMVERVLEYYGESNDEEALYLLQRCLFIKMETRISRWWNSPKLPPHRTVRTLLEMVRSWNWNQREVEKWEDFDILPMRELTEFKRKLETYMFSSLQALRSAGDKSESRAVTAKDFRKMTQRLTTIFNPDPHRTEWFYSPYNKMIRSDVFSIQEEQQKDGQWMWNLYTGIVDEEGQLSKSSARKCLKSTAVLPELVTWMLYNQLIKLDTKLFISHRRDIPFTGNLKRLSTTYRELIGKPELPSLDDEAFAFDPHPTKWLIVVNLVPIVAVDEDLDEETLVEEVKPVEKSNLIAGELAEALTEAGYGEKASKMKGEKADANASENAVKLGDKTLPLRAGRVPVSEDPFNAGPNECSIFNELFVIELNSWGEVYTKKVSGNQPVAQMICTIVRESLKHPNIKVETRCELGLGPYYQGPTHKRFISLLEGMVQNIAKSKQSNAVGIFQMNGEFVSVIRQEHRVDYHCHQHFPEAVHHANLAIEGDVEFFFDSAHPRLAPHDLIYRQALAQQNLLHILESKDGCMLTCVDQTGRYLFDAMEKNDFNAQWPPLLLSLLGAIRQWAEHHRPGKLRILREKVGDEAGMEITEKIFAVFQKMKDKLPRTQMAVDAKEAVVWMKKHANREHTELAIDTEVSAALKIHLEKGSDPFILSSVQIKNREKSALAWSPCLQLQLRQGLIRAGRKAQRESKS